MRKQIFSVIRYHSISKTRYGYREDWMMLLAHAHLANGFFPNSQWYLSYFYFKMLLSYHACYIRRKAEIDLKKKEI